nr:TIGR02679 domain-containing protein [Streptomyces sp. CB01635]
MHRLARTPPAAKALLADTTTALRALPADPAASLPAFAAGTLSDAHALDDDTRSPPSSFPASAP